MDYLPTVMPEVHADDHVTHIKAIMEWVVDSDGGILAKKENPDGFANCLSHLLAHKRALAQVQSFDMQLQQEMGLAPPPGAPTGPQPGGTPPAQ
jgi:hypothetical protein